MIKFKDVKLAEIKINSLKENGKDIKKLEDFLKCFMEDEVLEVKLSFKGKSDPKKRIENIFDGDGSIKPEYMGGKVEESPYDEYRRLLMEKEMKVIRNNKKKPEDVKLNFNLSDKSKVKVLVLVLEDLKEERDQILKELEIMGVDIGSVIMELPDFKKNK